MLSYCLVSVTFFFDFGYVIEPIFLLLRTRLTVKPVKILLNPLKNFLCTKSVSTQDWQEERQREFRRVIDLNADGKVSEEELKLYVDPKNPNHARAEARNLIELVDADKDGSLSLDEVLASKDIILGSKMVDTGQSLHDEF